MFKLEPELYNSFTDNKYYNEVLENSFNIINNKLNRKFDVIVDLGCAEGGITKLLSTRVPHRKLVAIDTVPDLLSYARQYNTGPTIDYQLQDMSVEWPQLSPQLRQLETTVDLVFANFVVPHFTDKTKLMSLISKLLAPGGGVFHSNNMLYPDLNKKLLPKYKGPKPWYPSIEKQIDDYRHSLLDNGFQIKEFTIVEKHWKWSRKQAIEMMPYAVEDFRQFYPNRQLFDEEVGEHLWDTLFDAYRNQPDDPPVADGAWKQFLADESQTEIDDCIPYIRIVAIKD
ncbi:uncharacterized protein LOC128963306 [Oppia nitens]|uniref:uncharacterized protein LOC128963306 n=1 Tax=Oppia nitens TaxID=1686743 RepID=UPI0023DA3268|nr:uncharacterized protein LOC128963306 [Oppia nitens]